MNYKESVICISLVIRVLVYRYFQIVTVHVCVVNASTGISGFVKHNLNSIRTERFDGAYGKL